MRNDKKCVINSQLATLRHNPFRMNNPLRSRWLVFSFSLWMCLVSGTAYCFGSYSHKIKDALEWEQHDVELMGELLNVGMCLGPVIGSLVDTLSARITYILALGFTFTGYITVGVLISYHSHLSPVFYGFFMLLAGFGSGIGFNTGLAVTVHNFRGSPYSARVIGFMSSMYGFSATVFSTTFRGFNMSAASSLKFMGATLASSYLIGALTVTRLSHFTPQYSSLAPKKHSSAISKVLQCFKTLFIQYSFWAMFVCFILGTGGGLMVINNIGNISKSLNGGIEDPDSIVLLVLTLSLCNGAGRILMGLSDYLPIPRAGCFTLALGVMCIAQLSSAFIATSIPSLYFAVGLVGLGYGMLWCILPTLVSEMFEVDNFGQNFGTFQLGPAIASVLFNSMAGTLYELHTPLNDRDCIGTDCYRFAFITASAAAFLGGLISLSLVNNSRTRLPTSI